MPRLARQKIYASFPIHSQYREIREQRQSGRVEEPPEETKEKRESVGKGGELFTWHREHCGLPINPPHTSPHPCPKKTHSCCSLSKSRCTWRNLSNLKTCRIPNVYVCVCEWVSERENPDVPLPLPLTLSPLAWWGVWGLWTCALCCD